MGLYHHFGDIAHNGFQTARAVASSLAQLPPPYALQDTSLPSTFLTVARRSVIPEFGQERKDIPEDWERIDFSVEGQAVRCLHAPVEREPVAVVRGFLGLKDKIEYYVDYARALQKSGVPVILTELPDPGIEIDYMPYYRALMLKALVEAPALEDQYTDIPQHILTHSTSGNLQLELYSNPETAQAITDWADTSIFASPFLTPSYTQSTISKYAYGKVYGPLAATFKSVRNGDLPPDWVHSYINQLRGNPTRHTREERLTHRQIKYMERECSPLIGKLQESGFPDSVREKRNVFILGQKDFASHVDTNAKIADMMGALKSFHPNGWHGAHMQRVKAQRLVHDLVVYGTIPDELVADQANLLSGTDTIGLTRPFDNTAPA